MTQHNQSILALDIGGSAVKHGIWYNEKLYHQASFPTPLTRKNFYSSVQELCDSAYPEFLIKGIAVSCPGEPDELSGIVRGLSYVPFLHLGEFQNEFSQTLHLPVSLQNDANSAALAEMTLGIGKEHQHALFTIIGSGIGLSVVEDGKIIKNTTDKINNFEKFIADTIKTINNAKVSPVHIGRTVSLKSFKLPQTIEGKDVFELAKQGNAIAIQEIERMYTALAEILLFLNEAFKPDIIGIGGGISNNPDLLPLLNKQIDALATNQTSKLNLYRSLYKTFNQPLSLPNLKICRFKNDANLVGAALHFEESHS